ncbi:MAG: DUF5675 family protein [Ignavibacteriales bacterium]|nr:DUF5675 family protein [Ignavibacteriales bacterium]
MQRTLAAFQKGHILYLSFGLRNLRKWTLTFEGTWPRTVVLFHPGNIPDHTTGCVLPGIGTTEGGIKNSRTAWGMIMEWFFSYWWDEIMEDIREGRDPFSNKKGVVTIEKVEIR